MQHKLRAREEALRSVETAGVEKKLQMAIAQPLGEYESRLAEVMNRAAEPSEKWLLWRWLSPPEREARKKSSCPRATRTAAHRGQHHGDYEDTLGDALVDRESALCGSPQSLTNDIYDLSRNISTTSRN